MPNPFRESSANGAGGVLERVRACRHCASRFAATVTAHEPRPVVRGLPTARILLAGQAPGTRVHASGRPFDDPSGERLRDWMGIERAAFYDEARIAIVPMAFCFPGQDARGADLPPPPDCARIWRAEVLAQFPQLRLTLAIGAHALAWHVAARGGLTRTVRDWRRFAPALFALPHPSWRNTRWLRDHPWFAAEVLPALRAAVAACP